MNITSIIKGVVKFIVIICAPMYEKWFNFYYHAGGTIRKMYYETRLKKCGTGLVVYGKPLLFQLHKISVGNHVTINNGVQIAPRGNVVIGDYVTLSRNAQIIGGQLNTSIWSGGGIKTYRISDLMSTLVKVHGYASIPLSCLV